MFPPAKPPSPMKNASPVSSGIRAASKVVKGLTRTAEVSSGSQRSQHEKGRGEVKMIS